MILNENEEEYKQANSCCCCKRAQTLSLKVRKQWHFYATNKNKGILLSRTNVCTYNTTAMFKHYCCCCCCCLCFIVSSRINGIYHLHVCLTMQTKKRTGEKRERFGRKTSERSFWLKRRLYRSILSSLPFQTTSIYFPLPVPIMHTFCSRLCSVFWHLFVDTHNVRDVRERVCAYV